MIASPRGQRSRVLPASGATLCPVGRAGVATRAGPDTDAPAGRSRAVTQRVVEVVRNR